MLIQLEIQQKPLFGLQSLLSKDVGYVIVDSSIISQNLWEIWPGNQI